MTRRTNLRQALVAVAALLVGGSVGCGLYTGGRWLLPRWVNAVGAGKVPRTAVGTVVKKERVHVDPPDGTFRNERFYVYYRIDEFSDIGLAERHAVLRREQSRYAKEGPRRMEVGEQEYGVRIVGGRITLKYAYYPSVLWGISDEIRVPW